MKKNALILCAHPDDETYGVGGTIVELKREGYAVFVYILTDGVTARHNVKTPQREAAERACELLGVDELFFEDLPDQGLDGLPLLDVIKPISKMIDNLTPKVVFTHHGGDVNQDHRTIFNATLVATRPFGDNPVKELITYEVASSTEWAPPLNHWSFQPNLFVDISNQVETKVKAALEYSKVFQSEVPAYPHPRSPEAIRIYAQRRGIEVGMDFAETFQIIRKLNLC